MAPAEITKVKFEAILAQLCATLTKNCQEGIKYDSSKSFEKAVREGLSELLSPLGLAIDFNPHPHAFPDIVLGKVGLEIKFTSNDTWRSVANSVFKSTRDKDVEEIYLIFGKMGGEPAVTWGVYDECVIHVRTSHVPRFEVELPPRRETYLRRWA